MRKKIEEENNKFNELASKRDSFAKNWKNDRSLSEMHIEVLHLMLRESVQIVENMDSDTKWQRGEIKIKCRDMQINKLKEQIMFRDELIDEARQMLKSAGVNQRLEDDRIVRVDEIIYDQPMGAAIQRDGRE